jgi:putative adhesin
MPTFSTPEPIRLHVDVAGADLTVRATDTTETVVDIRPHNPARQGDVDHAASLTAEHSGDRVTIRSPRSVAGRLRAMIGTGDRVDIDVTLPEGSGLQVRGWGESRTSGSLGTADVDVSMGDITIERAGAVHARTSMGDVRVESAGGRVEARTSAGAIHVEDAADEVSARTSAGDVTVGTGRGPLRLSTTAGDVRVESAHGGVTAKASAGDVRLAAVHGGVVDVDSSYGRVEVGVVEGVAAWLDVEARHGALRSDLEDSGAPAEGEPTVEVRVRAGYGDIVLRRV